MDLYEHVAEERGVASSPSAAAVRVTGDPNRLRQPLANLVDNAVKYTPTGGQVELTTPRGDRVGVSTVKDSGIGIAAEDLPRIWDRLYRADRAAASAGSVSA